MSSGPLSESELAFIGLCEREFARARFALRYYTAVAQGSAEHAQAVELWAFWYRAIKGNGARLASVHESTCDCGACSGGELWP